MMDLLDALFAEAASLQAHRVQAVRTRLARRGHFSKRQNILGDNRAAANVGMCTDAHKLMHAAKRADYRPFFHDNVTGYGRAIDKHRPVADDGVVANMRVGHDQRVAAQASYPAAFDRAPVDGDALSDNVMVADLQARLLASVTDVLRLNSDSAEREKAVVRAGLRRTVDR